MELTPLRVLDAEAREIVWRFYGPGWRVNPSPVLCHPGCIHCTPPSKAAA